jgi:hypothetical protein
MFIIDYVLKKIGLCCPEKRVSLFLVRLSPDHLLLDSAQNLGPLIYLVGKLTGSKIAVIKGQDFRGSKAFVSAIYEFVKFPTRYEWSNIRGIVQ